MRLFRKKQKALLALFTLLEFFTMNTLPASAGLFGGGPSIPSASSIMSDMEQRYHLDPAALQNQGETMNVSQNKGYAPEVMLSFSPSDPKEGEKMTAKAFPMYFSNPETELYYTWTLKHSGCGLEHSPSAQKITACDRDGDNHITVEDWKIEAAQIIVQAGYTPDLGTYPTSDTDKDGYEAHFGGNDKVGMPAHCYINDPASGTNYEFGVASQTSFNCPVGTTTRCLIGIGQMDPSALDGSGTEHLVSFSDTNQCAVSALPACVSGFITCSSGIPSCVSESALPSSCGTAYSSYDPALTCAATTASSAKLYCNHLFPDVPGYTSGDGKFIFGEEKKWGTNPSDASTADNGNKDEANVVGLGQSSFTWNYAPGDKVGVAVEGSSMFVTKYADSSAMIMWAFSKKDCPLSISTGNGSYVKSIKGYNVTIPVADVDLNDCIERNLVDPTEGGQATKLDVSVSASPSESLNDPGKDKSGDLVIAQATINNAAKDITNISFEWTVFIGDTIASFQSGGGAKNITADLQTLGLLGNTKGNALDTVSTKLDIPQIKMNSYIGAGNENGYLRYRVDVIENFAGGGMRKGNSDVIVKFLSTNKKITAYKVDAFDNAGKMKVSLQPGLAGQLCSTSGAVEDSDRTICRVIKNEIIGLKVDDPDLSNFYWTINGTPLTCTSSVSNDCNGESQDAINYFPVTGNVGDTYTVVVTANDVTTGKTVTLTRAFNVVEPKVVIESTPTASVWKKYLGKYSDIANLTNSLGNATCPGGYCDDLSESIYETYTGSNVEFKAKIIPSFISDRTTIEWVLDGVSSGSASLLAFTADKPAPGTYTVSLLAQSIQKNDIRKALLDIWGVSPFESPEINSSTAIQLEMQEPLIASGPLVGPRKYYAAIASYIPASILFTFRISLSALLIIFVLGILHSLLEERRVRTFVENFSRKG